MNDNLVTQLKEALSKACYMESTYETTSQNVSMGQVNTDTSKSTMKVDYKNKTGYMYTEAELNNQTLIKEETYNKYCHTTVTTTEDNMTGASFTGNMVMPVPIDTYELLFLPGGMLYPYNIGSIIEVCYPKSTKYCEYYTLMPSVSKCIVDYLNSSTKICKISSNEYKIFSIMNQVDSATNIPYSTTTECTIRLRFCKGNK